MAPQATVRCGTTQGYSRHQRRGEKPCDACVAAKREYDRSWRSAPSRAKRNRIHASAQAQAYSALARRHPDEYQKLYKAAKAKLLAEHGPDGKKET